MEIGLNKMLKIFYYKIFILERSLKNLHLVNYHNYSACPRGKMEKVEWAFSTIKINWTYDYELNQSHYKLKSLRF